MKLELTLRLDDPMDTLAEIKELTDRNAHTQAYLLGLEFLGNYSMQADELHARLEPLAAEASRLGYVSSELSSGIYDVYNAMMDLAREVLGETLFAEFYACF